VRVSAALAPVGSAAATLIFPEVARQTDTTLTALTERAVRVTALLVAGSALILALIAHPILEIAFGAEFVPAAAALRLLLAATVPLSVARVLAADLKGRGRPGLVSAVMGGAVALTIVFDLLLIPPLGIAGAALASLIAYGATAIALSISFIRLTGADARALIPTAADAKGLLALAHARRV
jgi:O-antigen/teichoic acid export membrane protein